MARIVDPEFLTPLVSLAIVVALSGVFLWAWRTAPGKEAAEQFVHLWRLKPWGRQVILDFYGLEVILAIWMIADAKQRGAWASLVPCLASMPVLGAISAAAYLLLRGV